MAVVSETKIKINYYLTAAAAVFIFLAMFLLVLMALGYFFILWSAAAIKYSLIAGGGLLAAAALFRTAAILVLEGWSGWWQGIKVLIGDIFYIFLRPRLWKLVRVSFYFPYHLARRERLWLDMEKTGLTEKDLIYGETPYRSLDKIIREIRPGGGDDLFVDLGCGIGKAVFFVALNYGIPARGIEINPDLFRAAESARDLLKIYNVTFINGHVLEEDFSEGTIFYIHGTSWQEEVYAALAVKFKEIKSGALVMSVSHQISADYLKLIKEIKIDLNWGRQPLYIYQRTGDIS